VFARVLVANRGEIACRIIRSLHALGVEAVAVYSDADRGAAHVREADRSVRLGPSPASESYLDADRVLEAALKTGADAVHPGYGFLAERAAFARSVEAAGLAFVGPTPAQLADFGEKHVARELAAGANVPLLPASGIVADVTEALTVAEDIGYPVMLKSSAGGGGIGMRVCWSATELSAAFAAVVRLSTANFGSAAIFVERFLRRARHVEVQVFGDGEGRVLSLGERDCSTQRRNQKVIEETPAPGLDRAVRGRIIADAQRLTESVAYRSAGTVELLVDADTGEHFFLEVNARLQVEHGVTELTHGVDLVAWMVRLAAGDADMFASGADGPGQPIAARGHAIEARVYAENPANDFRPSVGRLSQVVLPEGVRCDSWVQSGTEVTPFYDPLLMKVVAHSGTREDAIDRLQAALGDLRLDGVETNVEHLQATLAATRFREGDVTTSLLADLPFTPDALEVIPSQGSGATTVVAHPGRVGYWSVGVPPSGPMDDWSFRLGNRLLGNPSDAAGLECAVTGPWLRFHRAATVCLTGAAMGATLHGAATGAVDQRSEGEAVPQWTVVEVPAGADLRLGGVDGQGTRSYILFRGGVDVPVVLGSRTTFSLGGFGGHAGRALQPGDLLRIAEPHGADELGQPRGGDQIPAGSVPRFTDRWELAVIDGPQGAPDYLTPADVELLYATEWEVHYNSARTGIRLLGPRLEWARSDGGEAGLHPSNIHDNAYAVGTVDFTGDMPVILGPDGPSLGGFVCPATVIDADLWKLGQLRAGDTVRLVRVTPEAAAAGRVTKTEVLDDLDRSGRRGRATSSASWPLRSAQAETPTVLDRTGDGAGDPGLTFRRSGDRHLLVEVGEPVLDLDLRVRVQQLTDWFTAEQVPGVVDLTPGIRSLQLQLDGDRLTVEQAIERVKAAEAEVAPVADAVLPSRVVHLPLSWDDPATRKAIEIYEQSVRSDAPWCPSNLEFIRRVNGLAGIEDVGKVVFEADYAVYGLGDVYLGAPVATPLDPRHRLVTTKYNPARTWTPENAVGIGGAYLCVYGMEGPGGYQFVGRTTQVWHRWPEGPWDRPWLLRHFDRIRFYPVEADELLELRAECTAHRWYPSIEDGTLSVAEHHRFLASIEASAAAFRARQQAAFAAERSAWAAAGELLAADAAEQSLLAAPAPIAEVHVPDGAEALVAPLTARVWSVGVKESDDVQADVPLLVLEAMKTETTIRSPAEATVVQICCVPGDMVAAGQIVAVVQPR
jgi:urea carboxylase